MVGPKQAMSDTWKVIQPILEPVLEYGNAMRAWSNAKELANEIVSDAYDVGFLTKFLLAAVVLSTLIGRILPDETGGPFMSVDMPIVDDAIGLLTLTLESVLNAIIVYRPLRWLGGTGSLRHTLIAAVYSGAALSPLITLASGLFWQLGDRPLPAVGASLPLVYYLVKILAEIHRVPPGRALLVSIAALLAVGIVLSLVIAVLKGMLN